MDEITWEEVPCNICGSMDFRTLCVEDDRYFGAPVSFNIVECKMCGLVFTNPRIRHSNRVYEETTDRDGLHDIRKAPVFEQGLKRIVKLSDTGGRLLDIGCGRGFFLDMARRNGFNVYGIDPSGADADYARKTYGLDVDCTSLENSNLPEGCFDVVTLWDVIEHVPDPTDTLIRAGRAMKKGGLLVIRCPGLLFHRIKKLILKDILHAGRPVFGPTMHLYFFSPAAMSNILGKTGFRPHGIYNTPMEMGASAAANTAKGMFQTAGRLIEFTTGIILGNLEIYCFKQ